MLYRIILLSVEKLFFHIHAIIWRGNKIWGLARSYFTSLWTEQASSMKHILLYSICRSINARTSEVLSNVFKLFLWFNSNYLAGMKEKRFLLNKSFLLCHIVKRDSPKLILEQTILVIRIAKFGPLRGPIRILFLSLTNSSCHVLDMLQGRSRRILRSEVLSGTWYSGLIFSGFSSQVRSPAVNKRFNTRYPSLWGSYFNQEDFCYPSFTYYEYGNRVSL